MKIVMYRSRLLSSVRVPRMAGTVHPNPTIMGTKLLPGRPIVLMNRSITYAARDM